METRSEEDIFKKWLLAKNLLSANAIAEQKRPRFCAESNSNAKPTKFADRYEWMLALIERAGRFNEYDP